MKNLLQAHGIKVVNNQIAKADVEKAIEVIAASKDTFSVLEKLTKKITKQNNKIKGIYIRKDYDVGVFSDVILKYGKHDILLNDTDIDYPQDNGVIDKIVDGFDNGLRSDIKDFIKIFNKN